RTLSAAAPPPRCERRRRRRAARTRLRRSGTQSSATSQNLSTSTSAVAVDLFGHDPESQTFHALDASTASRCDRPRLAAPHRPDRAAELGLADVSRPQIIDETSDLADQAISARGGRAPGEALAQGTAKDEERCDRQDGEEH